MELKSRMNYVELFASKIRNDASLFKQQKMIIESQLKASSDLFRNKFGKGTEFKVNARIFLRSIGLL